MGALELFVTASVPVLKVLLVTGVGSFLATGSVGILCNDARKHFNNVTCQRWPHWLLFGNLVAFWFSCLFFLVLQVVFYVFNPALVSSNLSRTITMESMILLWVSLELVLLSFDLIHMTSDGTCTNEFCFASQLAGGLCQSIYSWLLSSVQHLDGGLLESQMLLLICGD